MSETPRTDSVVNKLQCDEAPFIDAYVAMRQLARELELEMAETRSPASKKKNGRKKNGRRPTSPTAKKRATRRPKS